MSEKIDVTKAMKKAERIARRRARREKVKEWWDDNKQYVAIVLPVVGGFAAKGIQVLGKRHNLKLEEKNKDYRCYDASLGHYWELKRKLTNDEWVYIDRRKNNGERLSDILDELKVLK